MSWYVHEFDVELQYGGPEEGGWWYDSGRPTGKRWGPFALELTASQTCRELNEHEHERREREERYSYTSVLARQSTHLAYDVSRDEVAEAYPRTRPHYE